MKVMEAASSRQAQPNCLHTLVSVGKSCLSYKLHAFRISDEHAVLFRSERKAPLPNPRESRRISGVITSYIHACIDESSLPHPPLWSLITCTYIGIVLTSLLFHWWCISISITGNRGTERAVVAIRKRNTCHILCLCTWLQQVASMTWMDWGLFIADDKS